MAQLGAEWPGSLKRSGIDKFDNKTLYHSTAEGNPDQLTGFHRESWRHGVGKGPRMPHSRIYCHFCVSQASHINSCHRTLQRSDPPEKHHGPQSAGRGVFRLVLFFSRVSRCFVFRRLPEWNFRFVRRLFARAFNQIRRLFFNVDCGLFQF